jgi:hypothetical protein
MDKKYLEGTCPSDIFLADIKKIHLYVGKKIELGWAFKFKRYLGFPLKEYKNMCMRFGEFWQAPNGLLFFKWYSKETKEGFSIF